MNHPRPIALLGCEVFLSELRMVARGMSHIVIEKLLEMGLHDRPPEMRRALQAAVDELDSRDDIEAIVLAYGLCGCGTAGLCAKRHLLVIPRAHDCITVLLGSKELHAQRAAACPGCYHYTPGWNRARRVPGPDREEQLRRDFAAKFDSEDVEFLLESERDLWRHYHTATFIDPGTPDAPEELAYTRRCADALGWKCEHVRGDPALLRTLLTGPWDDERFLVVPPGRRIAMSNDDRVMKTAPGCEAT
ncbi:MAG: DUF1638 domain-containing protein [Verrucomicrobiales bacterium]|nr:DUF1638 domain-containing protein [Verrucomicrobiales bacterium]